ncbi:zinc finger protein 699-like, partial [Adelges cooleyi]|uniref:zinc finger protein 699-like n=1 Tax=Adelges cooleyi TaxID=133065 RepID=UPI00217F2ABD
FVVVYIFLLGLWIEHIERAFKCPNENCNRNYKTKPGLYNHLKYEFVRLLYNSKSGRMNKYPGPSEDGLYYCTNKCGKKYKSKQAISVHMRYECGVKPKFYCRECDKYFKQPVSYKAHIMNVHKFLVEGHNPN